MNTFDRRARLVNIVQKGPREGFSRVNTSHRLFLLSAILLFGVAGRWLITPSKTLASISMNGGASSLQASAGIKTDKGVYPQPAPPALPSAGGKFFDPTFGTEIMRVTDQTTGANAGTAYSYWPTFNSNNTMILVQVDSTDGVIFNFNPTTFTLGTRRASIPATPEGGAMNGEDAIWSATDPDILYGHTGAQIWKYKVSTGTFTLVGDPIALLGRDEYLWQMSKSADNDANQ